MDPLFVRGGSDTPGDHLFVYYDPNEPTEFGMLRSSCQVRRI